MERSHDHTPDDFLHQRSCLSFKVVFVVDYDSTMSFFHFLYVMEFRWMNVPNITMGGMERDKNKWKHSHRCTFVLLHSRNCRKHSAPHAMNFAWRLLRECNLVTYSFNERNGHFGFSWTDRCSVCFYYLGRNKSHCFRVRYVSVCIRSQFSLPILVLGTSTNWETILKKLTLMFCPDTISSIFWLPFRSVTLHFRNLNFYSFLGFFTSWTRDLPHQPFTNIKNKV